MGDAIDVGPYRLLVLPAKDGEDLDLVGPLVDLAPALWEASDSSGALAVVLETLRSAFRAEWGAVLRVPEEAGDYEVLCDCGTRADGAGPGISTTILAELRAGQAGVFRKQVAEQPRWAGARSIPVSLDAVLAAVLTRDGHRLGVIYLENPAGGRELTATETRLFERLAGFAADQVARSSRARGWRRRGDRLRDLHRLERSREYDSKTLLGECPAMVELRDQVARVGKTGVTALILGETGSGKELVAQGLHDVGPRREGPFVGVNCAALPPELVESELFGHAEGAFTGATRARAGRFELAEGGTVFLDEFGELPAAAQAKLLRVLERREVVRVGEARPRPVDFHLVAATNADVEEQVREGSLREDLYYRVAVYVLRVPPLRERGGDVQLLADHFVQLFRRRSGRKLRGVSREARELLAAHPWPGNVRELRNAIEQAFVREPGAWIQPESLGLRSVLEEAAPEVLPLAEARASWERDYVARALRESRSVAAAARRLGMSRQALYKKCSTLGLDPASGEDAAPT
jgi:transcriptional regulator with GAF, ATPase, and Fis domain